MNRVTLLIACILASSAQVQSHPNENTVENYQDCGGNPKAIILAKLLIESNGQQRKNLVCNKVLSQVAFEKAKAMAKESMVDHNINHSSPNQLLTAAGVELPTSYEIIGNQVEAVSGGKESPQEAFEYFMSSTNHKEHLMGENDFYLEQNQIGVAHYYDIGTRHMEYWVVYITSFRGENEKVFKPHKLKFVFAKKPEEKRKRFKRGDTVTRAGTFKHRK